MFLRSKPELESFKKKKEKEKKYLGRAVPLSRPTESLFCSRESWPANLSLVPWLLEQRGAASSPHKASHKFFVSQATCLSFTDSLVLPLPQLWQIELMVGTTLAPFTYRFMEARIKNSFSQKRGHQEWAERSILHPGAYSEGRSWEQRLDQEVDFRLMTQRGGRKPELRW